VDGPRPQRPALGFSTEPGIDSDKWRDEAMHSTIWTYCAVGIVVVGIAAALAAQQQAAPDPSPLVLPGHHYDLPATLITAAQIEAHKKNMIAAKDDDVPMNMVKAGGGSDKYQVGVSVVNRNKGQKNPNYAVHDDVAEVYYVVEGKGRMKLGGKISDWKRRPVSAGNGRGSAGTTAVGARDVTIAKGDVLIIPAGTPHKWEDAEEFTSYVVVRIDPDGVAPLMALGSAKF
jgi:mannose-6-phosphate isomerase-like protein (cupin superfamily)